MHCTSHALPFRGIVIVLQKALKPLAITSCVILVFMATVQALSVVYVTWQPSPLEHIEMLEQLRVLWYGEKIHVAVAHEVPGTGVDTPEDLERVRAEMR